MEQRVLKKLAESQEMQHQVKRGTTSDESTRVKRVKVCQERKQMIS